MSEHMQGRTFEPPTGAAGYGRMLTPHRRPYPTADGYVCVIPYNDKHWRTFFAVAGKTELADDPRFADQAARSNNIDALYAIVAEVMQTRSTAEWLKTLEEADIPVMPMHTPEDLFECEHLTAVDMFQTMEHPTEGTIRQIKVPVAFSKTPVVFIGTPSLWDRVRTRCYAKPDSPTMRSPCCAPKVPLGHPTSLLQYG